jgi:uncharacterized damage-inducible protein DinB
MTAEEIQRLFEYNAWANRRAMEAASALTNAQFVKPMSSSFASVRDTLAHIYGAEWVWLQRFHGESPKALPNAEGFPDCAALTAKWNEVNDELLRFVRGLTARGLEKKITYTNFRGEQYTYTLNSMLQHLALHGNYHRGQVATLLRQLGAEPLMTDLLVYEDVLAGNDKPF